jgi:hypothetical protein
MEKKTEVPESFAVVVRFSRLPCAYHLVEVTKHGQTMCIQINQKLPRETVALFAAAIEGLGAI